MPSRLVLPRAEYKALCVRVMQRDKWKCRGCGARSNISAHHIKFRSEGGNDSSDNLVTLCQNLCHKAVHGEIPGHFIIILAKSGNPEDPIDADEGLKFLRYGRIRKRVKVKAKK